MSFTFKRKTYFEIRQNQIRLGKYFTFKVGHRDDEDEDDDGSEVSDGDGGETPFKCENGSRGFPRLHTYYTTTKLYLQA